jgi:predicted transcriptional regulator
MLTVTDQNLVHARCTAMRGSEDAGVVRLDEVSGVCGVEAGPICVDAIPEETDGEFVRLAGWSVEQAGATMTRDAAAAAMTAPCRVIALLAWSFLADVLLTLSRRT